MPPRNSSAAFLKEGLFMSKLIKPKRLSYGDTIGIVSPSLISKEESMEPILERIAELGFKIKRGKNLYSATNTFAGSVEERAEDFNAMLADPEVDMLLFGGGEVCNEILPYVDYSLLRKNPKIVCSYSDSTTILNALASTSGVVTFYGIAPSGFANLSLYNWRSFESRLIEPNLVHKKSSAWKTITPGACEGILIGGYLENFAALQGLPYYSIDKSEKHILFIEDHEKFSPPAMVSKWFANLEHRGVFETVTGLIFGHFSTKEYPEIDDILRRIGEKYNIPVVRCEDFGHGRYQSLFPIGVSARLDTGKDTFEFLELGVE